MAKFRVNTREFGRRIQAAARANGAAAMKAMQDVGHYLRGQVQLRTPVDEGNLTADIAMRVVETGQVLLMLRNGTRRGTRTRKTQILSLLRMPVRQPGRVSMIRIERRFSFKMKWLRQLDSNQRPSG